jgi:hypothetical protein
MATTDRNLDPAPTLTPEERAFIAQTLKSVQLRGTSEALRRAIKLIDSIVGKLGDRPEGLSENED